MTFYFKIYGSKIRLTATGKFDTINVSKTVSEDKNGKFYH